MLLAGMAQGSGPLWINQGLDRHRIELSWPAAVTNAAQEVTYPEYSVDFSSDLQTWNGLGLRMRGMPGRSGAVLSWSLEKGPVNAFFRIIESTNSAVHQELGDGGGEVFGYGAVFDAELNRVGKISMAEFSTNALPESYLPNLSWDPTTVHYWTNFDSTNIYTIQSGPWTYVDYNYCLDESEREVFVKNGFVVSERLGCMTFGDAYYRLFNADLPVFVSCDSILHAWHKSFVGIVEESEELMLGTTLKSALEVQSNMAGVWSQVGTGPLRESILDVDYYLTVARSLQQGRQVTSFLGKCDNQVEQMLNDIQALTTKKVSIFGSERIIDFGQFKPRGRYDASEGLRRYFRTMMWLSSVDLRLETFAPNLENDTRQMGAALVLARVFTEHGWAALSDIDKFTTAFFGPTDSMTPRQLIECWYRFVGEFSSGQDIDFGAITDLQSLTNFQTTVLTGSVGLQNIWSGPTFSPFGSGQARLARSFTLLGQKFTFDSWAIGQTVFDRVLWDPEDPRTSCGKVLRRKPSCLDVAYSVLGNSQVVPELVARMETTNGVPFRDGLPYQHNLLALRNTLANQSPAAWTDSAYSGWLNALCALSAPTTNSNYPEAMRTRSWAMKDLNTQLASWTQLRHDSLLYAKQSYTAFLTCSYPAGFLEPRPEFFAKMADLATTTRQVVSATGMSGQVSVPSRSDRSRTVYYDLGVVKANQVAFLDRFAAEMKRLRAIAQKELSQEPLTEEEESVFRDLMENRGSCTGVRNWDGWYPGLFYTNLIALQDPNPIETKPGCDDWDALITDVHIDPPDPLVGDPGAIIHEAVGNVNLMLIAIDNGPDRAVYAGPVFSHYEFETPPDVRIADSEWKTSVSGGQLPPAPEWTRSYLVPAARTLIPRGGP